jgi:N-acetylglucosamine-6-phosphate deacetylase
LAPGFLDVQVNGGGGLMFNSQPTVETILHIAKAHRRFGTVGILPTLLPDSPENISKGITAVEKAMSIKASGVIGIHLEGPIINPIRSGMHSEKFISLPDDTDLIRFCKCKFPRVITLAPEVVEPGYVSALVKQGVRVSAGHTEASVKQLTAACMEGLTGVTHLFNAMPPFTGRDPGVVGGALANKNLWCSIIADGIHVDSASITVAWRAKPKGKLILISDGMAAVGHNLASFIVADRKVFVNNDSCRLLDGRLAGSKINLADAVRYCVKKISIPLVEAVNMASTYPSEFLELDNCIGKIEPGLFASLVWFDDQIKVKGTCVEGELEFYD